MQFLIYILAGLILGTIGGVLYRWRGAGAAVVFSRIIPHPGEQMLFAILYGAIAYYALNAYQAAILYAVTVIMVLKAHGKVTDLGFGPVPNKQDSTEWYDAIIGRLQGKISDKLYDAIGLTISGLSYTVPVGLFIADPSGPYFKEGLILALSGALKTPAYYIGWSLSDFKFVKTEIKLTKNKRVIDDVLRLRHPTDYGEFLTGFFLYFLGGYVLLKVLGY